VYYLFFYPCLKSLMRVLDIPEVEGVAAVAPEVATAQVEVEVVLVAHPTTTTALDMDHPLTVLLALPI
ncbi:hypothetical protein, partial [Streptococcus pneumoniae]|uniref:hypothetical protein n=2 Tax=Streptococcus pneumoniae TaxID=1313 RepID=UPI001E46032B